MVIHSGDLSCDHTSNDHMHVSCTDYLLGGGSCLLLKKDHKREAAFGYTMASFIVPFDVILRLSESGAQSRGATLAPLVPLCTK